MKDERCQPGAHACPAFSPQRFFARGDIHNATNPTSTLKKKHNSNAYCHGREAIAAGMIHIARVAGKKNLADLFAKILPLADQVNLS